MAITAKPAAGTYALNGAATHAPAHLYMLDENSGTNAADIGTAAALDLTFSATTGSGPDWITDGTHGTVLDFVAANEDRARNTSVSGLSGTITVGALVYLTLGTASRVIVSFSDPSQLDRFAAMQWAGDENLHASSRWDDTTTNNNSVFTNVGAWSWVMLRFSDGILDLSGDGSAWDTLAVTKTGLVAGITAFSIGERYLSTPSQPFDDPIAAVAWWAGSKSDAEVSAIYNGGDIWAGMGIEPAATTARGRMLLTGIG